MNVFLGSNAVFRCRPTQRGLDVTWKVNGIFLGNLQANDITANVTTTPNGSHNCLYVIYVREERNNTVIGCVVTDSHDGKNAESNATLKVQGWFQTS